MTNKEIAAYVSAKLGRTCSHTNISHAKKFYPALRDIDLGDAIIEYYKREGKYQRTRDDRSHKSKTISENISAKTIDAIGNVELTHRGGCGELHFHNCNVSIYINSKEAK